MSLSEPLQKYYMSCREYFLKLKEGSFERSFLKYYKFLKGSPDEDGLILDVGCGAGQVVNRLGAEKIEVVGIDVSPIGIKLAHEGRSKGSNASFIVASGYSLPFRENVFRTVGCIDVLEHLQDPEACVKELIRVGKGRIVIVCPNLLCPVYGRNLSEKLSKAKKLFLIMIEGEKDGKFEHIQPVMGQTKETIKPDFDAVTITNPWNLKALLKKNGIEVTYHSSHIGAERIVDAVSKFPFFRSIGGGVFLEGIIREKGRTDS